MKFKDITTKIEAYDYLDQKLDKIDKTFQNGEDHLLEDLKEYEENYLFLRKKFYLNRNAPYNKFKDLLIKMDKEKTKLLEEILKEFLILTEEKIKFCKREIKNLSN